MAGALTTARSFRRNSHPAAPGERAGLQRGDLLLFQRRGNRRVVNWSKPFITIIVHTASKPSTGMELLDS